MSANSLAFVFAPAIDLASCALYLPAVMFLMLESSISANNSTFFNMTFACLPMRRLFFWCLLCWFRLSALRPGPVWQRPFDTLSFCHIKRASAAKDFNCDLNLGSVSRRSKKKFNAGPMASQRPQYLSNDVNANIDSCRISKTFTVL